jgi:hypothetical protein
MIKDLKNMSDIKNKVSTVSRVEPLQKLNGGKQGSLLLEVYKQKLFLFKAQRDLVDYLRVSDKLARKCQAGNNEISSLGVQRQYLKTDAELKKFDKKMEAQNIYLRKMHENFSAHTKKIKTTTDRIGKAEEYLALHQKELEYVLSEEPRSQSEIKQILSGCKRIKTIDLPHLKKRIDDEKKIYAKNPSEPLDIRALEKAVEYGEQLVKFGERVGGPPAP